MEAGGDIGQGQGKGAKFPTRTCEGYDANDGTAWGDERKREPVLCSSHTASKYLVSISLPQGLLKK